MKPYSWVIERVRELAAENPDRTARDSYFDWGTGEPECSFGVVLHELGARPVAGMSAAIHSAAGELVAVGYLTASELNWEKLGVTSPNADEAAWSDNAQGRQDDGEPWSEVVLYADLTAGALV